MIENYSWMVVAMGAMYVKPFNDFVSTFALAPRDQSWESTPLAFRLKTMIMGPHKTLHGRDCPKRQPMDQPHDQMFVKDRAAQHCRGGLSSSIACSSQTRHLALSTNAPCTTRLARMKKVLENQPANFQSNSVEWPLWETRLGQDRQDNDTRRWVVTFLFHEFYFA